MNKPVRQMAAIRGYRNRSYADRKGNPSKLRMKEAAATDFFILQGEMVLLATTPNRTHLSGGQLRIQTVLSLDPELTRMTTLTDIFGIIKLMTTSIGTKRKDLTLQEKMYRTIWL